MAALTPNPFLWEQGRSVATLAALHLASGLQEVAVPGSRSHLP
jgi:hypothetical protein